MTASDENGWVPLNHGDPPPNLDVSRPTWEEEHPGEPFPYLYTHCWSRPRELDRRRFGEWAGDVRTILANLPGCSSRGLDMPRTSRRRGHLAPTRLCGCAGRSQLPGVLDWESFLADPRSRRGFDQQPSVTAEPVVNSELVFFSSWAFQESEFYLPQRLDDFEWHDQVDIHHWPQRTRYGWAVDCCNCRCLLFELAVTAALTRLAFHFPEASQIGSVTEPTDPFRRGWDTEDWEGGVELCQRLFGIGALPFAEPGPVIDAPTTFGDFATLSPSPGGRIRLEHGYRRNDYLNPDLRPRSTKGLRP